MSTVEPLNSDGANTAKIATFGEYADKGEYHRTLDKNWQYYPVYVEKMRYVHRFLDGVDVKSKTIDLGCGEGLLVEEYHRRGYDIVGLDANYESKFVVRGDMTQLPFADNSYRQILCLDVIEHLAFEQQKKAVSEIQRVLHPEGRALISVPNLAHFASRASFALLGRLIRTSEIERHPGDRPIAEYLKLCSKAGLKLTKRKGLFPSFPLLSVLTVAAPGKVVWMHRLYNEVVRVPGICFLNLLEFQKKDCPLVVRYPSKDELASQ